MQVKIIVTKKSNPANVRMFEKAMSHFPTTIVKQVKGVTQIEEVRSLIIERRGF